MSSRTKSEKYLLVEGTNDKFAILGLVAKYNRQEVPKTIVFQNESMPALKGVFEARISEDDKEIIGIVVDADINFDERWQQIRTIVEESLYRYDVPESLPETGLLLDSLDDDGARLGVWIMPDNQSHGELEDFIRYLIPADDDLVPYADRVLNELESAELDKYAHKRSKAFVHTWLAWQDEPGVQMGSAINRGVLANELPDPEIAKRFVDWFNQLFSLQTDTLS